MVQFRIRCFSCTKKNNNETVKVLVINQKLNVAAFAANRTQVQGECTLCGKKCSEFVSHEDAWLNLSEDERKSSYTNGATIVQEAAQYKQDMWDKNKESDGASCNFDHLAKK